MEDTIVGIQKEKIKISFPMNDDNISCAMLVDGLMNEFITVPCIPEKLMDHRGTTLYLFLSKEGLGLEDIEFIDTEGVADILNQFGYMQNPVYVKKEIRARQQGLRRIT